MTKESLCAYCKHLTRRPWIGDKPQPPICTAFPTGIPGEILVGEVDHYRPYPGDRGIQYEPEEAPSVSARPA